MKQLIQKYLKIVIWIAIILFISLTPASKIPKTNIFLINNFDKVVHFGMYFIFSAIICRIIYHKEKKNAMLFLLPILISLVAGGLLEILQGILPINRSCSLGDIIANLAGGISGTLFFIIVPDNSFIKRFF